VITFLYLAILGLATWNISSLLVQEDGPFLIFARLRNRVGVRVSAEGIVYAENGFGELFTCIWCISRWVALVLALLFYFFPVSMAYICIILSLSTIAILVDRWT
jgi:hypothetical protein